MCLRTVLGVFAASFWTVSWHVCSLVGELRKHGYGSYHASVFARYFDVRTPRNCRLLILMHSRREPWFSAGYSWDIPSQRWSPCDSNDRTPIGSSVDWRSTGMRLQNSIHHPSKVEQAAVCSVMDVLCSWVWVNIPQMQETFYRSHFSSSLTEIRRDLIVRCNPWEAPTITRTEAQPYVCTRPQAGALYTVQESEVIGQDGDAEVFCREVGRSRFHGWFLGCCTTFCCVGFGRGIWRTAQLIFDVVLVQRPYRRKIHIHR